MPSNRCALFKTWTAFPMGLKPGEVWSCLAVSAFAHPRSPTRRISETSAGLAFANTKLSSLRMQDGRLFEIYAFRTWLRL
jgi:hypothetical protein